MKLQTVICTILLPLVFSACNPERVHYTSELKAEMADSKIKRITNADIIETVDDLGGKISAAVEKDLTTQLQKATKPADKTKLCQLKNLPRVKAIAERYDVDIRLLGEGDIQNMKLDIKERDILDAYLYSVKQKQAPISNIQKINDTLFVYNSVVPASNLICKACYGNQETPFAVWHVGFNKREVVRRMNSSVKKKKS
ncbi:hypothetical protein [Spirosoma foliorum]|uniref:DUF3365 domain-containing protein n=1 Tax=Spirosoma foliorum TaxID=2710596 RepID=A0A7G5GSQ5_9BACT|nr:hypothetical protein [Spirosoma foliorum]QMW01897.1 hypothetical protein H3H32_28770 [Spirosoma foliorum]